MDGEEERRKRLVRMVSAQMGALEPATGCSLSPRVAGALGTVPRHFFLPEGMRSAAYDNAAQMIGWGQTLSQPLIVALMTELLNPGPEHVILELGTGSGYQAAVLSGLVRKVYSLEVVPALADAAAERLKRLGYANVEVKQGDGRGGWPEHAPFDGIIVTAAAAEVPPDLPGQLKTGGRLVIPLGRPHRPQDLYVFEKRDTLDGRPVLAVAFVPLV